MDHQFEFEELNGPGSSFIQICRNKVQEGVKEYYFNGNKNVGIKIGIELLKQGYDLTEFFGKVYADYNYDCTKAAFAELLKENQMLNEKLLEEQFRPPELGGSEYKRVEQHFNSLQ